MIEQGTCALNISNGSDELPNNKTIHVSMALPDKNTIMIDQPINFDKDMLKVKTKKKKRVKANVDNKF